MPEVWLDGTETDPLSSGDQPIKNSPDVVFLGDLRQREVAEWIRCLKNWKARFGAGDLKFAALYATDIPSELHSEISFWLDGPAAQENSRMFVERIEDLKSMTDLRPGKIVFSKRMRSEKMDEILEICTSAGYAFVDLPLKGLMIRGLAEQTNLRFSFGVLQATRRRMSKTEYIACPSCGRTLFDLEETTARIRAVTDHLKGVKIAVMGCIVNGPGEMADADFGYVGGAPGKVNLYVQKDCVQKNIPSEEAPHRLVTLIKEHGRWVEPSSQDLVLSNSL
jgi:hypothetical protein